MNVQILQSIDKKLLIFRYLDQYKIIYSEWYYKGFLGPVIKGPVNLQ